jgi:hypothetical protein
MRATVTSFAGPAQGSEIPTCRPPVCEDSESRAESRAAQSVRLALPGPAESSDWESESAPGRESQSHGPGIMSHDSLAAEVHVKILTFQVTSHQ